MLPPDRSSRSIIAIVRSYLERERIDESLFIDKNFEKLINGLHVLKKEHVPLNPLEKIDYLEVFLDKNRNIIINSELNQDIQNKIVAIILQEYSNQLGIY